MVEERGGNTEGTLPLAIILCLVPPQSWKEAPPGSPRRLRLICGSTKRKTAKRRSWLGILTLKPSDQQGRSSNVLSSRQQASIYGLVFRVPLVAQQQKQASCQQHECWSTEGHCHDA